MGKSQRIKGHSWEREVARRIREALPGCEAKRGIQTRGGGSESGDVVGTPYHIECKIGAKPNPRAALNQALTDATPGRISLAVIKDDRQDPFVVMTFEDFLELAQENWALSNRG